MKFIKKEFAPKEVKEALEALDEAANQFHNNDAFDIV